MNGRLQMTTLLFFLKKCISELNLSTAYKTSLKTKNKNIKNKNEKKSKKFVKNAKNVPTKI